MATFVNNLLVNYLETQFNIVPSPLTLMHRPVLIPSIAVSSDIHLIVMLIYEPSFPQTPTFHYQDPHESKDTASLVHYVISGTLN